MIVGRVHSALDARDCRELGEFYRQFLGLRCREGEEPPTDGSSDDADWLVLLDEDGNRVLTIAEKKDMTPPTWPSEDVPMQMHMGTAKCLHWGTSSGIVSGQRGWAHACCTTDRKMREPLYVLADPAGHPPLHPGAVGAESAQICDPRAWCLGAGSTTGHGLRPSVHYCGPTVRPW